MYIFDSSVILILLSKRDCTKGTARSLEFALSQLQDPEWRSGLRHCSARGVTTDPGSIPGCIITGCDQESHRAAHNWPSVVRVRGGFGRGRPSL